MRVELRSRLIGRFLRYLRDTGVDVETFVEKLQLPRGAITDEETVVDVEALHAFFEAAETVTGDHYLGLHVAASIERGAHGLIEFVGRSASTVREALALVAKYGSVLNDLIAITFEEDAGIGLFEEKISGVPLCVGRHGNEYFVAGMLKYIRDATSAPCRPERVWLAHPAPRDFSELSAYFGTTQIEFGAMANGFAMGASTLDTKVLSNDPPLLALLDQHAEHARSQRPSERPFVAQLREKIRDALTEKSSTLESVASRMGITSRTLQRRLGERESSFAQELDTVREQLARTYVADSRIALGEIAFRLGYADERAFSRAFKRWTAKTPKQFRQTD